MLTNDVQNLALQLFGRQITITELRMMPYIQHVVVNSQEIDDSRINELEREILRVWHEERRIKYIASGLKITKQFWDAINQLVWLSYVDWDCSAMDES